MERRLFFCCLVQALFGMILPMRLAGAIPELKHLYPAGGGAGQSMTVVSIGKFDPWPPQAFVNDAGIQLKAMKEKNQWLVTIDTDVEPGPKLVRFFNDEGASNPALFVVDPRDAHHETDVEPNDGHRGAQSIKTMPCIIEGRLDKRGDVDSFAVWLEKGTSLVAQLDAFNLGSTMDALLQLRDVQGQQLCFNHDDIHFDPFLSWTAQYTGLHVIQVMGFEYPAKADIRLGGGEGYLYRLHLTRGPYVRGFLPLALPQAGDPSLHLVGWNLAESHLPLSVLSSDPDYRNLIRAWPKGCLTERYEPNYASSGKAPPPPFGITFNLRRQSEPWVFPFAVQKNEHVQLKANTLVTEGVCDLWMEIADPNGKAITSDDDSNGRYNPKLTWKAPETGTYQARLHVRALNTPLPAYARFSIKPVLPRPELTVTGHTFRISTEDELEIKLQWKRKNGYDKMGTVFLTGLPKGIHCEAQPVPDKDGELILKLNTDQNVSPSNSEFEIWYQENDSEARVPVEADLVSSGINNGVPQGFPELMIKRTNKLWLTVYLQSEKQEKD